MEQADLVIWLDYPFFLAGISQILRRTIKNISTHTPIAGGNQKTFYQQFFTKKPILLWVIQTHRRRRWNYLKMMTEGQCRDKWIRITNEQECEKFMRQMRK